jgi:hypothetical protein
VIVSCSALLVLAACAPVWADDSTASDKEKQAEFSAEHIDFFEKSVKPILSSNCFKCHGAKKKLGGELRLTNRAGVLKGGDTGPAVSLDDPDESVLLSAINYSDYEMPPSGKLPQAEIDILTQWVKLGAPWTPGDEGPGADEPAEHGPPQVNAETKKFWSFQPVKRPEVPKVANQGWVANAIDAFILERLEKAGLTPAPPASRLALMRRAYYDLTGLPPTLAEVDTFMADESPEAYEKLIDRLLASPQYGEKWGRHWLDLVHYAESNSFERDNPKPEVWRYRDYVIRAFNEDKPISQFFTEQLAGDELPKVTADSLTATGYYRLGLWDDESADPPQSRHDEMDDWVTVTSQAMLGLTLNCARCHSHKIDPIPQEDYYRFLAFFRGIRSFQGGEDGLSKGFNEGNFVGTLNEVLSPEAQQELARSIAPLDQRIDALSKEIQRVDALVGPKLSGGEKDDFQHESNRVYIIRAGIGRLIEQGEADQYAANVAERTELLRQRSAVGARVLCAKENPLPPVTHVKVRGNPAVNGAVVEPGFPLVLGFDDPKIPAPPAGAKSSGRRRVLAEWITSEKNPLTTRVFANRLWQYHFGRGIVRSPNNFGFHGDPPTHPELLDWLAAETVQHGWRLKSLHKLLMMSATYRMSSESNEAALAKDPDNNLFWRFNMRRLGAEEIRDTILATNGSLNRTMGGPSFYPVMPAEVLAGQSKPGQNWHQSSESDRARRSIYIHAKRSLLVPLLEQFDLADTDNTCPVRFESTQPTQALGMLNSAYLNEQARVLADRLRREAGEDVAAQVRLSLRLALTRPIDDEEVARGVKLIEDLQKVEGVAKEESLRIFCLMTLNLNEYVFLD